MKIYAIGDLHLALSTDKPMEVFGPKWENHVTRLTACWKQLVTDKDIVILCGDLSWAMKLNEAKVDLDFIDQLPGKKVCIKGNHDYWWEKIGVLNTLYDSIYFIQNTAYKVGRYAICGTRGWMHFDDALQEDKKIYLREQERLKLSLQDGIKKGAEEIIVALHYPPTNDKREDSPFTALIEQYPVRQVMYGHLHDETGWEKALKGSYNERMYHLVAADYLEFCPKLILEITE